MAAPANVDFRAREQVIHQLEGGEERIELERVSEKVGKVYLCTALGFAASFLTANIFAAIGLAGKVVALITASPLLTGIGLAAIGIGLIAAIHLTPREESVKKNALFGLFTVFQGLALSPLVLVNAPVFASAAAVTVGITGTLSFIATKMQTQFERLEKVMMVALGAIAVASLGSLFLTGVVGAVAHQISLVGGFALFGAYVIYDTQKIKEHARLNEENFDVIDHTMGLYLDVMNIFVRVFEVMDNNR